jgi:hypothetical protein
MADRSRKRNDQPARRRRATHHICSISWDELVEAAVHVGRNLTRAKAAKATAMPPNKEQREDEVLDTLIVAALSQMPPLPNSPTELEGLEDCLDEDDRRVLEVKGADVVSRVLAEYRRGARKAQPAPAEEHCWDLASRHLPSTAVNLEEIERKLQEHQEQQADGNGRRGRRRTRRTQRRRRREHGAEDVRS